MPKDLLLRALKASSVTCSRVFCALEATCVFLPLENKDTHLQNILHILFNAITQRLPSLLQRLFLVLKKKMGLGKMAVLTWSDLTLLYMRDHAECGWMSPCV